MKMIKTLVVVWAFISAINSQATTYYAVATGNWTGAIWSTTPGGSGSTLPTLVNGDIIVISDFTVTVNAQITTTASVTINLISNSTSVVTKLAFDTGKKLALGSGSAVYLSKNDPSYLNPIIDPGSGGGSSNLISVGGTDIWKASNGQVSGTGQLIGGTLPITLVSFTGALSGNGAIDLEWTTSSESNFDHFNVEKSHDGMTFTTFARVEGHGTTNIRQDYSTSDATPVIGLNYYRLTSVDFDNYTETFKTIAVKFDGVRTLAFSPNPFNGSDLNVASNFDLANGTLSLFDGMGSLVVSLPIEENKTLFHFENPLKSGVYIAKFSSPVFSSVVRLVVQ